MAKHSKLKLPKRIAGIKIPKVVRKGPLGQFLNSGAGQMVLAETLMAAAAAFTAAKVDDATVGEELKRPVDGARRIGKALLSSGTDEKDRLAHAFKAAGTAFGRALHAGNAVEWQEEEPQVYREEFSRKKSAGRASSPMRH